VTGEETFISGWLDEVTQEAWGRPVDVQELSDGSLLISDDMANVIYRVSYSETKKREANASLFLFQPIRFCCNNFSLKLIK